MVGGRKSRPLTEEKTMKTSDLLYGPADQVANALGAQNEVSNEELTAALVNALTRIHNLEARLEGYEKSARKTANDVSCMANGIIPD